MRKTPLLIAATLAALASATLAQDRGLTTSATALGGAFWQARFEQDSRSPVSARSAMALGLPAATAPQSLRLLSDYQLSTLRLGDTGGLRLTGGLLINLRNTGNTPSNSDSTGALPYAGIGYSSGNLRGEWGFSADLGLAAPGLSPARMDRLFGASTALGLDNSPRLLPMVRLGVNLAF